MMAAPDIISIDSILVAIFFYINDWQFDTKPTNKR